jgi:predicted DCC family thiol-disulfide oxidoreductase YuxK
METFTSEKFPRLLFFDGECVFCNRWVDRVKEADPARLTRFATKQGATFQRVVGNRPELAGIDSIVLAVHRTDGGDDFLVRSAAVRQLMAGLPRFRFFSLILRVVPTPLSDLGYRMFAMVRLSIFGKLDQCRVPLEDERELFLD